MAATGDDDFNPLYFKWPLIALLISIFLMFLSPTIGGALFAISVFALQIIILVRAIKYDPDTPAPLKGI